MQNKFAKRASSLQPSDMRIILTAGERPELISFAGGLPAPDLFPIEALKAASEAVLSEEGPASLQYSATEGYIPLRQKIIERMKAVNIPAELSQIMITSGSQQAIDLTGRLFLDEGDTIICESPTYLAAINAFKTYDANFVEVDMDEDGMIMEALEKRLQENPHTKFIYTIPDFQNPTGRTLSLERRKRMIELANRYDVLVLEDNPYGAIRFSGTPIPPVKHFDTEGRVIYLSSFSKIFAPGLRLGWICADQVFIEKYIALKESSDMHTDGFAQRLTSKYMEQNDIEKHIANIKAVYKARCTTMIQCIEEFFPENISFVKPEGGLFLWVELPPLMDSRKIALECLENNVAVIPGGAFFADKAKTNTVRLNFSNTSEERIKEGMKRIGKVLHREMASEPTHIETVTLGENSLSTSS
ncbi:PLP-dependent aminotransferase family protein [Planomicrobium sp. CPCC 101110]|uniref:aminotransferase-like domain-containing protein n=1 Tax=Planomicrobium sp. CPCC 101110 TaxID=2599619 RepID=UPI0011B58ACA|nr:PLP-dependent aminotransferase family protein [Planomicrobium sp. CPCC 101110]TWT25822.1 PLP-dependent aminotransferase family protein [Planomicrobium sp. CPCC 101110]